MTKDAGLAVVNQEESPHGIPKYAEDAVVDYAEAVDTEMDGTTKFKISTSPETTYKKDIEADASIDETEQATCLSPSPRE